LQYSLANAALQSVCSDHLDVDSEEVRKREPEADFVEQ